MVWKDFRSFVAEIERRGNLRVVEGADPVLEIGALTELMCERMGPMLLFENIKGYAGSCRIAAKPYSTPLRSAIAMEIGRASCRERVWSWGGGGDWRWWMGVLSAR